MSRHAGTRPARDLDLLLGGGSVVALDDGALLDRVVSSPSPLAEAAFEALIRRHGPMVARVCGAILVGDPHAAEDATQAVFLVLARRVASIRNPDRLAPWLHGVALRTAREARNRALRRRKHLEHAQAATTEGAAMIDPRQDPTSTLIRREQAELLHRAIARLPSRYLAPVVLCDLEGLTHAEAASRLHCPVSTVSIRLKRAREQLRSKLARHHLDFESAIGPVVVSLPRTLIATAGAQILANRVAWTTSAAKWKAAIVAALVAGVAAVGAQGNNLDLPPAKPIVPPLQASKPQDPPAIQPTAPPEVPKEEENKVQIGFPTVRGVSDSELFTGRVVASRTVEIRPRVSGVILSADVAEGDLVREGQLLFKVDDGSMAGEARDVKAQLGMALQKAERVKSTSKNSGDPAEVKVRRNVDELTRRLAEIEAMGVSVVAPFAGQVASRAVDVGATVEAGVTPMATITAIDPIQVDFQVDHARFLKIQRWVRSKPGMTHLPVKIDIFDEPNASHRGHVLFRTTQFVASQDTQGHPITVCTLHAETPNADRSLVPGLSAFVTVEYGDPCPVILIPWSAFLSGVRPMNQTGEDSLPDNNRSIAVVEEDGSVREKWIKVGEPIDGLWSVVRGIGPKTRIVLSGAETLRRRESFLKPAEAAPK